MYCVDVCGVEGVVVFGGVVRIFVRRRVVEACWVGLLEIGVC